MTLLALSFCLGIVIARYIYTPIIILYIIAGTIILLALVFSKRSASVVCLYFLSTLLGAAVFINSRILTPNHIAKITPFDAQDAVLKGAVCDYPQRHTRGNYTAFTVDAQELIFKGKLYKVKGRVLVKLFRKDNIQYGQRLLLKGKISKPYAYGKSWSYREYLKRQGIYSVFAARKDTRIEYLGDGTGNVIRALAYKLRARANSLIFTHMPFTQAAIFSAMILGDRSNILSYLNRMFIQTGTIHILARQYTKIFTFAL